MLLQMLPFGIKVVLRTSVFFESGVVSWPLVEWYPIVVQRNYTSFVVLSRSRSIRVGTSSTRTALWHDGAEYGNLLFHLEIFGESRIGWTKTRIVFSVLAVCSSLVWVEASCPPVSF